MTVPMTRWSALMVDDNPAMREAIARSLARRGCAVTTVADAAEALASLRRQSFDVIVTDLNMPERGGLWLWRQAVVLRPELRGRFLLKPLSLDTLWRLVEEATQGTPQPAKASRAESRPRPADRVGGAP